MNKLSTEHIHFSNYDEAGRKAESILNSFARLYDALCGIISGTLESIIQTAKNTNNPDSFLGKENIQNFGTVLNLIRHTPAQFIELYEECAEFFERSSILTNEVSSFHKQNLKSLCMDEFDKNKNKIKNFSPQELKSYILEGQFEGNHFKNLHIDLNQDLNDMLNVWHDENANVVCQECNKLYDNYEEAYILFKNGVEDFFARLENLEQGQESVRAQEEKQEYSASLQELEDKILTNEETGKSYLVLDIPDEEIKEEQEDNKVKTNKETRKSYLVIEDEMSL